MANFKLTCLAAFLAAAMGLSAAGQPAPRQLSLAEVMTLVADHNPGVLAGEEGVLGSEQYVRQARSALLPQVSAQASQGRSRNMQDQGGDVLKPWLGNSFSAGFVANLSLIDARNIANYKAAKLEARAARYQQDAFVQDSCARAAQLYFLFQRCQSSLSVVEKSIELDRVLLDRAEQRRAANVATDLDVTRARATLARDRQRLLAAETQLNEARLALLSATGLDLSLEIAVASVPPPEPVSVAIPDWKSVLHGRPEYKAAGELLERNRVAARAASWQRFPSVAAQGSYGHVSRLVGDDDGGEAWGVSISMSMPLFDSGNIDAQKKQALSLIRQQEHLIRQIEDNIHSSYDLAIDSLSKRWAELPLAQENVHLAELELQYAREQFEAGVSDNSDVIVAQVALSSAGDSLVDAVYRYQLARIDLARVLGEVQSRLSE
ncbi:MAG TPA: TolC family protein [Opitutales bacterium]|nr:TolC family protein [Opitutales bacterium]